MQMPDTLEHVGEHLRRMHSSEDMDTGFRNNLIRLLVKNFAIDYTGCVMKIVGLLGGPGAMGSYPHHPVKTVDGLFTYGQDAPMMNTPGRQVGVREPFTELNRTFIAMMLSPLTRNVPGLSDITAVGDSTVNRLYKGVILSKEILGDIEAFIYGWRAALGAPRRLFIDGAPGLCGHEGCVLSSVSVIGFSGPKFAMKHCVAVLDEVLPVCLQHKDEMYNCAFQHEKYLGEVVTLKAQLEYEKREKDNFSGFMDKLEDKLEAMKKDHADQLDTLKMDHTDQEDQLHRFYAERQRETALLFECELQQQIDISAGLRDDASTITAGANILLQEQFSETQQNYIDLRREIDRVRRERAALELAATQSDALTTSSSDELARVLSALSDATYRTANSGVSD